MTVEFELSKDDYKALQFFHSRHSPAYRRIYRLAWFGIPVLLLPIILVAGRYFDTLHPPGERNLHHWIPLGGFIPVFLILFPWAYRRMLGKIIDKMVNEGKNIGMFGPRRLTISPESLAETSEDSQTTIAWRSVERIVMDEDETRAYIYVNALAAFVVPRRAFPNPADFDAFIRTAKEYHGQAQPLSPRS